LKYGKNIGVKNLRLIRIDEFNSKIEFLRGPEVVFILVLKT
jgi:hypothetical protein